MPKARRRGGGLLISVVLLALLGAAALVTLYLADDTRGYPGVVRSADAVSCADAADAADAFAKAVAEAKKTPPDYTRIKRFGFSTPASAAEAEKLLRIATARQAELDARAVAQRSHTCTDHQTVRVVDADGSERDLPVVIGSQPDAPASGSESNQDPRTVPVTIGTKDNSTHTNSWTQLNDLFGSQQWYTDCANSNLAMAWGTDVPKYIATEEGGQDSRFILAVNTADSLDDEEIRRQVAADSNTDTAGLTVVRAPAIINTRNLDGKRCDPFVDTRSQVRVSLGKLKYDESGVFQGVEMGSGIFVDCHNLWRLPRSVTPTSTPSTTPVAGTTPPSAPPTTLQPKDPSAGPAARGNVPTQVQGANPPAGPTAEPRPADPPTAYSPPAPPPAATTAPAPVRTTVPPPPPRANPTATFDPCNPVTPACG
jgi:hypothetical protein